VLSPFVGFEMLPKQGDYVLIDFVDKDFNSPVVLGSTSSRSTTVAEHTDGSLMIRIGGTDISVSSDGKTVKFDIPSDGSVLIGDGAQAVARVGDTVTVNVGGTNYTGSITTGSAKLKTD
jgi:hypothetical protein